MPPVVPKPKLPANEKIVQGEFEATKLFEKRAEQAVKEFNDKIDKIRADYRQKVEARNQEIARLNALKKKREQELPRVKALVLGDAFRSFYDKFSLENATYDRDENLIYYDLVSGNGDFLEKVSLKPEVKGEPALPDVVRQMVKEPNLKDFKLTFSLDDKGYSLKDIVYNENYLGQPNQNAIKQDSNSGVTRVITIAPSQAKNSLDSQVSELISETALPEIELAYNDGP